MMSGTAYNGGGVPAATLLQQNAGALGTDLAALLLNNVQIDVGSEASYQLCKTIYLYHPLGAKLAEKPIVMALSMPRVITVSRAPDRVVEAFFEEWEKLGADNVVRNVATLARVYGVASVVCGVPGVPTNEPLTDEQMLSDEIYFNVLDPLNTSGSLVLNQMPNAPDFQKPTIVTANGLAYHPSRASVMMHEQPVYIAFTSSAYGYVGRSVYQRILFPLKSFLQTMLTDDMISQKAGVLIAKIKPAGSIADRLMDAFTGIKRSLLKGASNYNVLSIAPEEDISSLNLQNIDGAASMSRDNILKNIAVGADMPSKILSDEVFVKGFGEGTEDSKYVAHYIDGERKKLGPLIRYFDEFTMRRAWNPSFFESMRNTYPEQYGDLDYRQFFFRLKNDFKAVWPSLLSEPDSEKVKVDEAKYKAVIEVLEVLAPNLDPDNKVRVIQWAVDNINESELLFKSDLQIDPEQLAEYLQEQLEQQQAIPEAPGGPGQPNEGEMPVKTGALPPKQPQIAKAA